MDVDPVAVKDQEGLVAELRALKAACGKSTTAIASDAGLSTSGIEGVLAGTNFPTEETVRRFVEACGVVNARPWLQARARAAENRPKVARVAPEVREELEALRAQNAELSERMAALEQRVRELENRNVAELARAADRALMIRLAKTLPPMFRVSPARYLNKKRGIVGNPTGRYEQGLVDGALRHLQNLISQGNPVELLVYLAALPRSMVQMTWASGGITLSVCAPGYEAEEVDRFFYGFRAAVERELEPGAGEARFVPGSP